MTQHQDQPRPKQPLAQVDLVLEPDAEEWMHTDVELWLEPVRDPQTPGLRSLQIRDLRSGLPIMDIKLDADQLVQLAGGRPVRQRAWLMPQPQRDALGRYRVPLTVRVRAGARDDRVQRWVESCRERLASQGLVDYNESAAADVTAGEPVPVRVCTYLLYPGEGRRPSAEGRRLLRASLAEAAGEFGLELAQPDGDEV